MAKIPIPKLLEDNAARKLNDKMLENNHTFIFLNEGVDYLNGTPSTFREAFGEYVRALYVLYHDCGMEFINCYLNEEQSVHGVRHSDNIKFVINSRVSYTHSPDEDVKVYIYNILKNYFFSGVRFSYTDWHDFWKNANEADWETLVTRLVSDSDGIFELLDKIAAREPKYTRIRERTAGIFLDDSRVAKIYERSFDHRFRDQIDKTLSYSCKNGILTWRSPNEKRILKSFVNLPNNDEQGQSTPGERILDGLIRKLMNHLKGNPSPRSEELNTYIIQTVKELIEEEADQQLNNDEDELLD